MSMQTRASLRLLYGPEGRVHERTLSGAHDPPASPSWSPAEATCRAGCSARCLPPAVVLAALDSCVQGVRGARTPWRSRGRPSNLAYSATAGPSAAAVVRAGTVARPAKEAARTVAKVRAQNSLSPAGGVSPGFWCVGGRPPPPRLSSCTRVLSEPALLGYLGRLEPNLLVRGQLTHP